MTREPVTLTIGSLSVEVSAVPLGQVRRIMGAVSRVVLAIQEGAADESTVDDMLAVLSATMRKPIEELEALETNLVELNQAFEGALRVSGLDAVLRKASDRLGEARPGASPASIPSTSSTPVSPPTPDGPGTTSTPA